MASIDFTDPEHQAMYRERYVKGKGVEYRYEAFITEVLGIDLTDAQRTIVRSVEDNPRTSVVSGNGFGKSFTMACLSLAWMYCNNDAFGLVTGGNNSQLKDGLWSDLATLHKGLKAKGFPGRVTDSNQDSRLKFDERPNHMMRCLSARNAGSLEGKHSGQSLVVIEEANKPTIDRETIRSALSTVTDEKDRAIVIGNPPERGHPFDKILKNDRWNKLHFTAFDSRNVRRQLGEVDAPEVDGIITPYRIKDIWMDSHPREEYPGLARARWYVGEVPALNGDDPLKVRTDLHEDWYRLVQGETPPANATGTRPFYINEIERAGEKWNMSIEPEKWDVIGIDLATGDGSDSTVAVGVSHGCAKVLRRIERPSGRENAELIREAYSVSDEVVCDAIREENFLDELNQSPHRFKGSTSAQDKESYYNARAESYFEVGDWMNEGGALDPQSELYHQLMQVAEVCKADVKSLKSAETYILNPKDEIKRSLDDSSPDLVDSLAMAVWLLRAGNQKGDIVDAGMTQRELFGGL